MKSFFICLEEVIHATFVRSLLPREDCSYSKRDLLGGLFFINLLPSMMRYFISHVLKASL